MVVNKVFVARHGERIDHVDKTWKSRVDNTDDPFLTERGLKQATQLGVRLAGEGIGKIFVSPFYRTIQTANAAAASIPGAKLHLEHGICELLEATWYPGQPRLRSMPKLTEEFPNIVADYNSIQRPTWPETKEQCFQRVEKTVKQLVENETGNILLIGHGITVDYSIRALLHCDKVEFIHYCALFELARCDSNSNGCHSEKAAYKFANDTKMPDVSFMDEGIRPMGKCATFK